VPAPALAPGMAQPDPPPSQRIASLGLLACAQLARPAGEPEVIFGIRAPVRPRNDVVNCEWPRHICLGVRPYPHRFVAAARTRARRAAAIGTAMTA
jgi:hypothetical protein